VAGVTLAFTWPSSLLACRPHRASPQPDRANLHRLCPLCPGSVRRPWRRRSSASTAPSSSNGSPSELTTPTRSAQRFSLAGSTLATSIASTLFSVSILSWTVSRRSVETTSSGRDERLLGVVERQKVESVTADETSAHLRRARSILESRHDEEIAPQSRQECEE
jgi:hypothetical protein